MWGIYSEAYRGNESSNCVSCEKARKREGYGAIDKELAMKRRKAMDLLESPKTDDLGW